MSGITGFVSDKSRQESVLEHFNRLCKKAKSKKEIREIEMHVLRPEPIETYRGKRAGASALKKRSVLFVFSEKKEVDRLARLFRVHTYISNNTHDIEFVTEALRLIEAKRLIWNKKKKRYHLKLKDGRKIRI